MGEMRRSGVGALLTATIVLSMSPAALAGPPAGPGDDPGTQAKTTQATVDRAKDLAQQACEAAQASAAARDADPTNVEKTAKAAADAADCAARTENAGKEEKSLAGVNGGIATEPANHTLPADVHNPANGAIKSDNIEWVYNSRGQSSSFTNPNSANGNYAGATFISYENLGYDFMFGDGTAGLTIWSLKDPAKPLFVSAIPNDDKIAGIDEKKELRRGADAHGAEDPGNARFYEGENPTVDSRRKLAFLARDPRSFGNNGHPGGRTGLYIIDVKDPFNPEVLTYHWVPAGHTATCINDCRYLWSVGPANNGSRVSNAPQDTKGVLDTTVTPPRVTDESALHRDWTGVPGFVTDVRDPLHPYTYAQPVDVKRNNNTTAYTHSVDVDQHGIAWTSGFGGVRGYYTHGLRFDPVLGVERYATATDPVPYAGGSVPSLESEAQYGSVSLEHNSYHRTQAASDKSSPTVTTKDGRTFRKEDLQYITQENVASCTSTSGGGSGRFVIANLADSYTGKAWDPNLRWRAQGELPANRYFIEKLDDYTPRDLPGSNNGGSCSAHWFTVVGDMVAIAFYSNGTRILDVSDPTDIQQAGYIRIPSATGQPANNASAAYWHDGYIYIADYSRGIDVLRYTGTIKGEVQPLVCWNSCDASQTPPKVRDEQSAPAGATVPATLSLTLGTPASFGAFTPGVARDYNASSSANVISTAGDGVLSVADPSASAPGHLVNGTFSMPSALQAKASSAGGTGGAFSSLSGNPTNLLTYAGPISNDAVTLDFMQRVGAGDALRTGTYSKTLTFTLSTTQP
jgi:hypothetical protein